MTAHMASFGYIPDILSEMLAGEDTLVDGDDKNNNSNNNNCKNTVNTDQFKKLTSEDGSCTTNFTTKAKRGRPCAKPPTKEILRRRRKVDLSFCLTLLVMGGGG